MTITPWAVSELHTLLAGLVALRAGHLATRSFPTLRRLDIPAAVIGGVLASLVAAGIYATWSFEVRFATALRDLLLLVFFVTIGLSAKLSALRAGGRALVWVGVATIGLLIAQNVAGMAIAVAFDVHPFVGLLAGSISFVGGPGTALAWAGEGEAMGVAHAREIALAAATLAVTVGALVAGPLTGWVIGRHGLQATLGEDDEPLIGPALPELHGHTVDQTMRALLLIFTAVAIGDALNAWIRQQGFVLPGFLTAMLAGVALTNLADATGLHVDYGPIERQGEMALQAFLAISLMSLQLWAISGALPVLLANLVVQIAVTSAIALWVLFPLLGRDYDAAVTVGGFLGFGLSSMPVAMATMEQITSRFGPAPRAVLLITLAGSFFVDLANALAIKAFLLLPPFR